jgi:hypothetical protein
MPVPLCVALPVHKKRADAIAADGVTRDVKTPTELQRFVAIQDVRQRMLVNVADRAVEETGSNCSIGLHNCRYPWRVASGRSRRNLSQAGAEAKRDTTKFLRIFDNEA